MKKGIIFDIGNVIQQWSWKEAARVFREATNFQDVTGEKYKAAMTKGDYPKGEYPGHPDEADSPKRRKPWSDYETSTIAPYVFTTIALRNMGKRKDVSNAGLLLGSMKHLFGPPRKEIVDMIRALDPKIKKAILSNSCPPLEQSMRGYKGTNLGYVELFEEVGPKQRGSHVYLSHLIGVRKPEEGAYRIAVSGLHLSPNECLFIDNKKRNVDAAAALGIKSVQFTSIKDLEKVLKPYFK